MLKNPCLYPDDWFVCKPQGTMHSRRTAIRLLQAEFALSERNRIIGEGSACWNALWLAAHHNIESLLLNHWTFRQRGNVFRSAALKDLFAIVCPVVLLNTNADTAEMLLPNAQIYTISGTQDIQSALKALQIETNCEQICSKHPKLSVFTCDSAKTVYNSND